MIVYHIDERLHVIVETCDDHVSVDIGYRPKASQPEGEMVDSWRYRRFVLRWTGESLLNVRTDERSYPWSIYDISQRRKHPD